MTIIAADDRYQVLATFDRVDLLLLIFSYLHPTASGEPDEKKTGHGNGK
jgi:hypothetical protein